MAEISPASISDAALLAARRRIIDTAEQHPCSSHALFAVLENAEFNNRQIASLLRNYDAHASVLRRLLLNAAALMPEAAVTFVLENVRNEYGNGDYSRNHQAQLRDLAWSCGISERDYFACKINQGISDFLKMATRYYSPRRSSSAKAASLKTAAVTAGAITATELLAIKEFAFLQKAFIARGLQHHIWFHHVEVEKEHSDESLALALHFAETPAGINAVEYGLKGVLDANVRLYDGLLAAVQFA
jgi:hypothetical protein